MSKVEHWKKVLEQINEADLPNAPHAQGIYFYFQPKV